MRRRWMGLAIGGSLLLMGSSGGIAGQAFPLAKAPNPVSQAAASDGTSLHSPRMADAVVPSVQSGPSVTKLGEVNGVSLSDDRETVVAKLGVPVEIAKDPLVPELEIYHYANLDVTFSGPYVHDVAVAQGVSSVTLDGVQVAVTPAALREALGDPDYVAEDGLVYQRGARLLKVYLDEEQHRIDVIRYYSLSNT
ncbi:hypothetical protein [Gorillibacterium sp. sgz500922]|uniref:hypothetical protein n=1 Tax=Gorillibacterium sp. sgz500922 TaxID=3446694 RepID=UPI003F674FB6